MRVVSLLASSVLGLCVASAVALPSTAGAQEPRDYELTRATCPVCTPTQIAIWNWVRGRQLGVSGSDPVGPLIGTWPAERNQATWGDPWGTDNLWFPQAAGKRTLCGTLDHFNFFDGSGDEADWANYMRPSPSFRYLITDVRARHGATGEWHRDDRGRFLMEAEVTPDEHYYENPWFPKSAGRSVLEGRRLCTYGPWVGDKDHDLRPEIHPSELYWWRSGARGYLLLLQDDSNRYDRRDDYDFDGDPTPSWWRPWSASPRTGEFRIAFSARTSPSVIETIRLGQDAVRHNVLGTARDVDDGTDHSLVYEGRRLLTVSEGSVPDSNVAVDFSRVCRDAANTRIYGFVGLRSAVGRGDRGEEGYHLLRFDPSFVFPGQVFDEVQPAQVAPVAVRAQAVEGSTRTVTVRGRPLLVADVEVRADPTGGRRAAGDRVAGVRVRGARDVPQSRRRRDARRPRVTVPLTRPAALDVQMRSGYAVRVPLVRVAPAPEIGSPVLRGASRAGGGWRALVAAAGGRPGADPPGRVKRVTRLRLTARAAYAPLRDGRVGREEGSPFSEELTEALERSSARERMFGGARAASLFWSFRARHARTGRSVPVRVDRAARSREIRVRLDGRGARRTADVKFPRGGPYELVTRVRMRDALGHVGRHVLRVSSPALVAGRRARFVEALVRAAAELAGGSPDEIAAETALEPPPTEPFEDLRSARARAVLGLARAVVLDRHVALGELRSLVAAGRLWARTPRRG